MNTDRLPLLEIEHVRAVTAHGRVPVVNESNAEYALDGNGRRWVRKRVSPSGLLGESISYLLCRAVGAPVPESAVFRTDDSPDVFWLSSYVDAAKHWEGSRSQALARPDDLGAILAVDAVVGNFDRHAGNILLRPDPDASSLAVFGIDFGNCWAGMPDTFREMGVLPPPFDNLAWGIPLDMIENGALDCAARLSKIDESAAKDIVSVACRLAREFRSEEIVPSLAIRCGNASTIVRSYLQAIREVR